jgi:alpha-L-fucosidase
MRMYQADNNPLKSVDYLMEMYYKSVSYGAVLLLNNTPDPTGLIPETDVKRSAEFGAEIKKRFGKSLAETSGKGDIVTISLDKPTVIDHAITMEDTTGGERVRQYVIEGRVDNKWNKVAEGISIGHKKIDRFRPVLVDGVRIRVTKFAAEPLVRKLAVYKAGVE